MDTELAMKEGIKHGQWWGWSREAVQRTAGDGEAGTVERSEPFRPRRGATGPLGTKLTPPRQDRLFPLMRLPSWPVPSGSSAPSSSIVLNNLSSAHLTCRICPVSHTCRILPATWLVSRALKSGFFPVLLLWKVPWSLP